MAAGQLVPLLASRDLASHTHPSTHPSFLSFLQEPHHAGPAQSQLGPRPAGLLPLPPLPPLRRRSARQLPRRARPTAQPAPPPAAAARGAGRVHGPEARRQRDAPDERRRAARGRRGAQPAGVRRAALRLVQQDAARRQGRRLGDHHHPWAVEGREQVLYRESSQRLGSKQCTEQWLEN